MTMPCSKCCWKRNPWKILDNLGCSTWLCVDTDANRPLCRRKPICRQLRFRMYTVSMYIATRRVWLFSEILRTRKQIRKLKGKLHTNQHNYAVTKAKRFITCFAHICAERMSQIPPVADCDPTAVCTHITQTSYQCSFTHALRVN